jgi:hypothetical protein
MRKYNYKSSQRDQYIDQKVSTLPPDKTMNRNELMVWLEKTKNNIIDRRNDVYLKISE